MTKLRTMPVTVWAIPLLFVVLNLFGCGDGGPDSEGNNDTLFTGLSGLVVVAIVAWLIIRSIRKRNRGDGSE